MLTDTTTDTVQDYNGYDDTNCSFESQSPIYAKYWNFYDSDIDWFQHPECPCTAIEGDSYATWSADFDGSFIVDGVQVLSHNTGSWWDEIDGATVTVTDSVNGVENDCGTLDFTDLMGQYAYVPCTDGLGFQGDGIKITAAGSTTEFCDIIVEGYPVIADYVLQLEDAILDLGSNSVQSGVYYDDLVSAYDDLTADYGLVQEALTELDGEYTALLGDYEDSVAAKTQKAAFIGVYESRKLSDSCLYCAPGGCQFCSTPEVVTEADLEEEEEEEEAEE